MKAQITGPRDYLPMPIQYSAFATKRHKWQTLTVKIGDWLTTHRQQVMQKLAWLQDEPVDVVWERWSALHRILITREGRLIRMYFADPHVTNEEPDMSGAMSAMKLSDPFDLSPTPYNQAMMLSLLWQPNPKRVYFAGFAGGRVPLVFYHYFPRVVIDSTDIDEVVGGLAERFFGIQFDERQRLYIQDGREFLAQRRETTPYDFIFVDVFRGTGFSPLHLATAEFYALCKRHMTPSGVIAVNLVQDDELLDRKLATIASCFKHVYLLRNRTVVLFGTNGPLLTRDEILEGAKSLQAQHQFAFPFLTRAAALTQLGESERFGEPVGKCAVLRDGASVAETLPLLPDDPLFYGVAPGDLCPCGSGKKLQHCHGRT